MSIQKLLAQKLKAADLTAMKASKIAGMSYVGFCNLLKGKSKKPLARSLPGLAKLLGKSVEEIGGQKVKAASGSDTTLRAVAAGLAELQALVQRALEGKG